MKYYIQARYQTRNNDGISWTDWYCFDHQPREEEDCKKQIKIYKEKFQYIDKITKLKHEYRLFSEDEYNKISEETTKRIQAALKESQDYYKSDEYKRMQKIKRQARKEQKEREAEYKKSHENK